jgi:hypothetical protein
MALSPLQEQMNSIAGANLPSPNTSGFGGEMMGQLTGNPAYGSPTTMFNMSGTQPTTLATNTYNNNYSRPTNSSLGQNTPTNMTSSPLTPTPPMTSGYTAPAPLNVTAGGPNVGSFGQGSLLPNVTTTQQQVTAAPSFYTDYLNQLATQGQQATQGSQFAGTQPLQQQAFDQVSQNVGNYQPTLQNAINLASGVGNSNLAEAVGNLGNANIARNLAPQTTSGIVGSGQFGSTRGAQALGDTLANASLEVTAEQAKALQQDYQNKLLASQSLSNLAGEQQKLGLGDVNALSAFGGQQQTIAQNQQLFPMQQLMNQAQLLRGYTIPTSVSASQTGPASQGQFGMSPLQQISTIGTLGAALATPNSKTGVSAGGNFIEGLSKNLGSQGLGGYLADLFRSPESSYNNLTGLTGKVSNNLYYFNNNPTDLSFLDDLG